MKEFSEMDFWSEYGVDHGIGSTLLPTILASGEAHATRAVMDWTGQNTQSEID
jgi:hypothetical protein